MIGASLRISVKPLEELDAFTAQTQRLAREAGDAALEKIRADFMAELSFEPASVKYPIEWTSDKQRKAFFASDGFGGGIPSQRSGGVSDGWTVRGRSSGGSYVVEASNAAPYAKFVVGDVNFRSRQEALKPMQKMHINTGWQPAIDTIAFWFDAMGETYDNEFDKAINRQMASYKIERRRRR